MNLNTNLTTFCVRLGLLDNLCTEPILSGESLNAHRFCLSEQHFPLRWISLYHRMWCLLSKCRAHLEFPPTAPLTERKLSTTFLVIRCSSSPHLERWSFFFPLNLQFINFFYLLSSIHYLSTGSQKVLCFFHQFSFLNRIFRYLHYNPLALGFNCAQFSLKFMRVAWFLNYLLFSVGFGKKNLLMNVRFWSIWINLLTVLMGLIQDIWPNVFGVSSFN